MREFQLDGLGDDEEIEELANLINPYELEKQLKFSKNGIVKYIDEIVEQESKLNQNDPKLAKEWEEKVNTKNVKFFLKKDKDCPYMRSEMIFEKKFKMQKLAKCIFGREHKLKYDPNFIKIDFYPIRDFKHCGTLYNINKK